MGQNMVLFVEGISDRRKVQQIVTDDVQIICTNGTVSREKLEEWVQQYDSANVYLLFDADESGDLTRKKFIREFSNCINIYVNRMYREVATTPLPILLESLVRANLPIRDDLIENGDKK